MLVTLHVIAGPQTGRDFSFDQHDTFMIGRSEDAQFCLPQDRYFSRHHCLIEIAPPQAFLRDLGSTNGTFINGQKITEGVLKPSQILRLGQVEVRLESDTPASAGKQQVDKTMVVPQGVKLNDLEQGPRSSGFDTTSKAFSKKSVNLTCYIFQNYLRNF